MRCNSHENHFFLFGLWNTCQKQDRLEYLKLKFIEKSLEKFQVQKITS